MKEGPLSNTGMAVEALTEGGPNWKNGFETQVIWKNFKHWHKKFLEKLKDALLS